MMRYFLILSAVAILSASCTPASSGGSASNDYPLEAEACWGAGGGGGTIGFWLYNWGDGTVTVRNDLSRIIYPDGSERQAISEMDLRRYRETKTFQRTVTIGAMQQGMLGYVSADGIRYDERVGGWVYGVPGTHLVLVADTPAGRVNFDTRRGC